MKKRQKKSITVDDSTELTINFPSKSFSMTGNALLKVIELYWSEKTTLKVEAIVSSRTTEIMSPNLLDRMREKINLPNKP